VADPENGICRSLSPAALQVLPGPPGIRPLFRQAHPIPRRQEYRPKWDAASGRCYSRYSSVIPGSPGPFRRSIELKTLLRWRVMPNSGTAATAISRGHRLIHPGDHPWFHICLIQDHCSRALRLSKKFPAGHAQRRTAGKAARAAVARVEGSGNNHETFKSHRFRKKYRACYVRRPAVNFSFDWAYSKESPIRPHQESSLLPGRCTRYLDMP